MSSDTKPNIALTVLKKVFGTKNERLLKKYTKRLPAINALFATYDNLSNEEILVESAKIREEYQKHKDIGKITDRVFALTQVVALRKLGMKHYDVQLLGGLILSDGAVAEMKTGEGKTLVATLPASLQAFTGNQVHVVTVNDYLANRDAEIMRPVYEGLGLTVSALRGEMGTDERRVVYAANIIYGTNHEFAFDYLRNNIAPDVTMQVQPPCFFALIDEVDSILIDEARTPLIISGEAEVDTDSVEIMNEVARQFDVEIEKEKSGIDKLKVSESKKDAILNIKAKSAILTEVGFTKLEELLVERNVIPNGEALYLPENTYLVKASTTALRAIHLFDNNVDYLIDEGKIKIINESTGRIKEGSRWSDGLHQAIEAKEGVKVNPDNKTIANISLQNFFRQYEHMAGMTGTGDTEAAEFMATYGMEVVVIPTNKTRIREDYSDKFYFSRQAKYNAMINDIKKIHETGRPILIGTDSVDESTVMASILEQAGLKFNILNAINHAQEADIIAKAGEEFTITISTNMAGRGTDILLGGNPDKQIDDLEVETPEEVARIKQEWQASSAKIREIGGLHVIGTSRNESRRIDLQLCGRAGRQGDPGSSQFYVSSEDQLLKKFGNKMLDNMAKNSGFGENDELSHPIFDRLILKAQAVSEGQGSNMRAELLKYDDVINKQRSQVFDMRQDWLIMDMEADEETTLEYMSRVRSIVAHSIEAKIEEFMPSNQNLVWDPESIDLLLKVEMDVEPICEQMVSDGYGTDAIKEIVVEKVLERLETISKELVELQGVRNDIYIYRSIMIRSLDQYWFEQIDMLNELREGIHLRGYAQKNPLMEFGFEAMELFKQLIASVQFSFTTDLFATMYGSIEHQKRINETIRRTEEAARAEELIAKEAEQLSSMGIEDEIEEAIN
ncbi:preprotein translocase subunit SecA [Vibrio splendidus]|nr:preprotein translocase subunit SecA [Vibrio splendidus]MCC4880399.1 preprotein translocase subunit SecA [Vibrio splendidus]